jgi:hypothetical protein
LPVEKGVKKERRAVFPIDVENMKALSTGHLVQKYPSHPLLSRKAEGPASVGARGSAGTGIDLLDAE